MSLRGKLAKLKKLLLARDSDLIVQGVELAVATEDGELIDALLDGVTYDPDRDIARDHDWSHRASKRFRGGLRPNKIFSGTGPAQPFHDLALLGLVSLATAGERAPALRRRTVSLVVGSDTEKAAPEIPLRLLAGLDHLEQLRVESRGDVSDLGLLARLPRLERLQLRLDYRAELAGGLSGLGRSPSLSSLELASSRLESLAGLEGSRLADLEVSAGKLEDIEALRGLPIERLILRGGAFRALDPIAALPRLARLELDGCGPIESFASLAGSPVRELAIADRDDDTPRRVDLVDLPGLERLDLRVANLAGLGDLRGVTALEQLRVSPWESAIDLRLAQPLPALRVLDLRGGSASIGDASWYPALEALEITNPTDLDEVARLPALERFELRGRASERLDVLPAVAMTELDLSGSEALVSIRGVGALRGLERLSLRGCTSLISLAGLEALSALALLDLRGCASLSDVSALAGATSLRAVLSDGCPLIKSDFPGAVAWCVSSAKDPDIGKLLARTPPATKKRKTRRGPVPAELLPAWDDIKRSLRAPTYDQMNAIADRARELGAAALYDALLLGTEYQRNHFAPGRRLGTKPPLLKQHLVRRLVAEAPADCAPAAALREAVTWLWIRGETVGARSQRAPVDLGPLAGLPRLEKIQVDWADRCESPGTLAALPALRELAVEQEEPFDDLGFLGASPVRELRLNTRSLAGIEALARLERLDAGGWRSTPIGDLAPLSGAGSLRSLSLSCDESADLGPLWGLAGLTELSLAAPQLADLSPLRALENLESLTLSTRSRDLTGLSLPKLRSLTLRPEGRLESLAGAELSALVELTVYRGRDLIELGDLPPSLQRLELHDVEAAADLGAIGRAPRLWHLTLDAGARRDLGFIAGGAPIERLELRGAEVEDVSAAAGCLTLRLLSLQQNGARVDLATLAGHPGLQAIDVPSSCVDWDATPDSLRPLLRRRGGFRPFEPR